MIVVKFHGKNSVYSWRGICGRFNFLRDYNCGSLAILLKKISFMVIKILPIIVFHQSVFGDQNQGIILNMLLKFLLLKYL
jgi:hypothetical protein